MYYVFDFIYLFWELLNSWTFTRLQIFVWEIIQMIENVLFCRYFVLGMILIIENLADFLADMLLMIEGSLAGHESIFFCENCSIA